MNLLKEGSAKEVQASKISIDSHGIAALFYGQFYVSIINLNDNQIKVKSLIGRKSKEISECQWNKHGDNIAVAVNNVCKIYDFDMNKILSLKTYNKPISSIDWHPGTKHQIISSSYDNIKSISLWDIRNSKFPTESVDIDKVQQVKWHKFNANIFASSSDSDIHLWDRRNLSSYIKTISAHLSHVSDFDWLPCEDYSIISCGLNDGKIKLWNIGDDNQFLQFQEDEHDSMCCCNLNQTGSLLMTISVPEAINGNQLTLWDVSSGFDLRKVSSHFTINTTIDVKWRKLSSDNDQIVTLHKNFDYKIWTVDSSIPTTTKRTKDSSFKIPIDSNSTNDRLYFSRSSLSVDNAPNTVFSETFLKSKTTELMENVIPRYSDSNLSVKTNPARLLSNDLDLKIQKEFDKLVNNIHVVFEKNPKERRVITHLSLINAKCSFIFSYRGLTVDNLSLDVAILPDKSDKLRKQNVEELDKILKNSANKNVFGILKCVDVALDYLNKLSSRVNVRSSRTNKESSSGTYSSLPDINVPYPRTCGAKFSPSGMLVCFISPPGVKSKYITTPRSFVNIAKHSTMATKGKDFLYGFNIGSGKVLTQMTFKNGGTHSKVSGAYSDMDISPKLHSLTSSQKYNFNVYIYNATRLSLFSPNLARKYSIDVSDIDHMCQVNSSSVSDNSRKDLIEFWQYCAILAAATHPSANDFNSPIKPWSCQLLGRQMCTLWLDHFLKIFDIQSAAMLILVMLAIDSRFDEDFESRYNYSLIITKNRNPSMEFAYDNTCNDNTIAYSMSHYNLYSGDVRNYFIGQNKYFAEAEHQCGMTKTSNKWTEALILHKEYCRLIESNKMAQYGMIILQYSRMLSAQSMLTAATKITRKILPTTFFSNVSIQDQFSVRFMQTSSNELSCSSNRLDDANILTLYTECAQRSVPHRLYDHIPKIQVMCSICRLHVQGLLSLCALCNHGGHIDHIMAWFSRTNSLGLCPTGCGCQCTLVSDNIQEFALPLVI